MDEIIKAVKYHHDLVAAKGYHVVMTSLVGSQNYNLHSDASDIDTYSFIFPSLTELANADDPKAGIIFAEDGHCNFKDIRFALNLLKKTSPNSVEYFTSKYKVYNPIYNDILSNYLDYNVVLWNMIHCNYKHMLYAIAGMAYQLTKRSMPAGKRYSHALRLNDMIYQFFHATDAKEILDFRPGGDRNLAFNAKYDIIKEHEDYYNNECKQLAGYLTEYSANWQPNDFSKKVETTGMELINKFQMELFKKYLMETNK